MNHDYCHCGNKNCPKASKCYRALLVLEDIRIHQEKPDAKLWCSYSGFQPDEHGHCDHFIEVKND